MDVKMCGFISVTLLIVFIGIYYLMRNGKRNYANKLQSLKMNASQYESCKKIVQEHLVKKKPLPRDNQLLTRYIEWWWKHDKDLAYVESDSFIVSCVCISIYAVYNIFYYSDKLIPACESLGLLIGWTVIVLGYVYSIGSAAAYLLGTGLFNGNMYIKTIWYWINVVIVNILLLGLFCLILRFYNIVD